MNAVNETRVTGPQESVEGAVLIIEDNLMNLDMARELLQLAGLQTYEAENAQQGIELAKAKKPDLILMDLHMPNQDGFITTRILKSDPALKDIPIVAFTALAMKEDHEKAIEAGCLDIISKPIDVTRFAEQVMAYIPQASSSKPRVLHPVRPPAGKPQVQPLSEPKPSSEPLTPDETGPHHTVLVVDDNAMNVELLKDALEDMGQTVLSAYNGYTAIQLANDEKPDLILLDIMMPDLDGYGVLEALKANPVTEDIPVIFVSALNKTQDMVRGLKLGTYDYITKPYKIEEVKARVNASLRIKDLQDSLRLERDKLDCVFRYSADGIALLANNMDVISANPVFGKWFDVLLDHAGKPQEPANFFQLLGCQCEVATSTDDPCPFHTPNITLTSNDRTPWAQGGAVLENAIIPANGQNRYLNIHGGKVKGLFDGNMEGYVVIIRDVTRDKTIEQSKETFVATLTHDLKTPIRAEYQALELMASENFGPLNTEQQEILKEIIQSNRYMSRLVESLLTTYKYEEGKLDLKLEPTDLNALIESEIAEPLRTLAQEKQQAFNLVLAPNLPPAYIDPIEVQRVINNLVQNAVTYTPEEGQITLATAYDDGQNLIRVDVVDNGPGIEADELKTIFDRYKSSAKRFKKIGTGLGLYLSRKIVEAHGGQIDVESTVGQGSRFCFTLPVAAQ